MAKTKQYLQIDLLKGLAILFVIIGHTLSFNNIQSLNIITFIFILSIFQAVPIFFILMGRNMASSFENKNYRTLKQILNKTYFRNRLRRIVYPLIIVFLISAIIGIILNKSLYFGLFSLIGLFPLTGPGNYFVSILLEFIIVFPIVYLAFKNYPKLTLFSCFLINLTFELVSKQYISIGSYVYGASILRYLFLICLGIMLININNKSMFKNKLIVTGFVLSMIYLVISFFLGWFSNYFISTYQYTTLLTAFYPLMLVIIGLKYLPHRSNFILTKLLALIGKASYHIFLVQILFFGAGYSLINFMTPGILLNYFNHSEYCIAFLIILSVLTFNLFICLSLGLLFYFSTENPKKLKDLLKLE